MATSTTSPTASTAPAPVSPKRGLVYSLIAHAFWGLMPLYLLLVHEVPPLEFVAWRLVFTLPLCLGVLAFTNGFAEMWAVLRDRPAMVTLIGSAALVAINWFIYVQAIQTGHIYAASLGYYILPLTMMLLGLVFLGEKLDRLQWSAVALAAVGVGALAMGALSTLWLSLALGISFGLYGLLRKLVQAGPVVGLTLETLILMPAALALVGWYAASPGGSAMSHGWLIGLAVAASGLMTAVPLIMFATAARALPYTVIGFLQFLSPTLVFILGLTVFGEELKPAQAACYVMIWLAAGLFTWAMVRGRVSAG
ncbi:MAG: EamA family transporter RarD [Alteraurantiacibacter sp.]